MLDWIGYGGEEVKGSQAPARDRGLPLWLCVCLALGVRLLSDLRWACGGQENRGSNAGGTQTQPTARGDCCRALACVCALRCVACVSRVSQSSAAAARTASQTRALPRVRGVSARKLSDCTLHKRRKAAAATIQSCTTGAEAVISAARCGPPRCSPFWVERGRVRAVRLSASVGAGKRVLRNGQVAKGDGGRLLESQDGEGPRRK